MSCSCHRRAAARDCSESHSSASSISRSARAVMWTEWAIGSLAFSLQLVLPGQALEGFEGRLRASGLDVFAAFAKELHHLGPLCQFEQTLVAGRILNDQFGFFLGCEDH